MLKTHVVVLLLFAIIGMVACGGGTSSLIDSDLSADDVYMGITAGDFKVVRANDAGYRDSSLNRTLGIQSVSLGDVTEVIISVSDVDPMYGVTLELNYDPLIYNPVDVEFSGLIDTPVEAAFTSVNGLVAVGQVDVNGPAVRSGEFAVVTFANEPSNVNKAVSAVHDFPMEHEYAPPQLTVPGAVGWDISQADSSSPVVYSAHATWAVGDGNSDGESGVADLTPIVSHGYFNGEFISDTNFAVATADYDANGGVTVSDITPLGQNFLSFTTGIEILVGDADPPTDVFATLDWNTDSGALTLPAAAGTTDWDNIFRTWNGEVSLADLTAVDTAGNGDSLVYVAARLTGPDGSGDPSATFTANLEVPPEDWIIDGFTVQIVGASGGTGTGGDEFADGNTADVGANSQVTLNVVNISGTFEGAPITGAEPGFGDILADIGDRVQWSASTTGHADLQYTAEALVLSGASGNGVTGDTFPDDDMEADPEGMLVASVSEFGTYIPASIQYTYDIDVMADDTAPVVDTIVSSAGMEGDHHAVSLVDNTVLEYYFDFGTGGAPGDLSSVGATIYNLTDHSEVLAFSYNDPPTVAGDFSIVDDPGNGYILRAILGAGNLAIGSLYTLRIEDTGAGVYNSVNKPGEFLTLGEAPPTVTFRTLPSINNIGPNIDDLWIFYPEPKMRRIGRAQYNIAEHVVQPYNEEGFNDVIKTSGNEFWFENPGGRLYPWVAIVEDADPSSIGEDDGVPGTAWYACPGFISVDIAVLTTPGNPGDPTRHFGFRVFSASGPSGGGTFDVQPEALAPMAATGVDFGINIFGASRDLLLDSADWGGKVLTADTAATVAPETIYIEFGGGRYTDFSADPNNAAPVQTQVRFHSEVMTDHVLPWWDPCAALDNGNLILSHGFTIGDFHNAGVPGWPGELEAGGEQYTVQLLDPTGTIVEWDSEADGGLAKLTIVGTNPNDL